MNVTPAITISSVATTLEKLIVLLCFTLLDEYTLYPAKFPAYPFFKAKSANENQSCATVCPITDADFGDTTRAHVLSISHPFAVNFAPAVMIAFKQLDVDNAMSPLDPKSEASHVTFALATSASTFPSMSLANL